MKRAKTSFLTGAFILASAGMTARMIGLLYRIPLTRLIGDEGVGIYQYAYPIYGMLLVISVSGIPVALAKLISDQVIEERWDDAIQIFKVAKYFSFVVGVVFTILLMLNAKRFIQIMNYDQRSYYSIMAIAPAIPIVSVVAAYRGFFMGLQQMIPTAISQVSEQIIRIITMIFLVYYFMAEGIEMAAAGAAFGAVTGGIVGYLIMLFYYYQFRRQVEIGPVKPIQNQRVKEILKQIFNYAIPVTIGALVLPLMSLVDAVIVPSRLQLLGLSPEVTTRLYGQFTGIALVLVNFPGVITISIRSSLVPAISTAYKLNQLDVIQRQANRALRLAMMISLPAATGLFVLAGPLCQILFKVGEAGQILKVVAWSVIFIAIQQITSGILQGMNQVNLPVRNLFIGAGVNAVINYLFTAMPAFGIRGAAFGTMLGFAVAAGLNLRSLCKTISVSLDLKVVILKPLVVTMLMGGVVYLTYYKWLSMLIGSGAVKLAVAVLIGIFVYFAGMYVVGGIRKEDLGLLPFKPLLRRNSH